VHVKKFDPFYKHLIVLKDVIMSEKTKKVSKVREVAGITVNAKYILKLYVTGILPNSTRAIKNIHTICDQYLNGRYELEVIDIYQQPSLALTEDLIAVPVLVKKFPLPEEKMVGDLSNTQNVLKGLSII
jgi:circadian clock protein KaiB